MSLEEMNYSEVAVRGISFKLMTYTRSLELCARMNYETENLDFIDTINPNEVLYDLGACEGRFSIYAALKGVRVISFEPEAKNFLVFSQNIVINAIGEDRLKAINAGVGAKNGNAIINIGQPWEGGHQKVVEHGEIRNDLNFNFVENQEIKLFSIDSFVEKENYPPPNYLKIDIDGSEMPFLIGATKTLKSKELKGIIFELNESDPNFLNIITLLSANGFVEHKRFNVPNEVNLFNILFEKR
jgi:FkbM family methyltransferase